MAGGKCEHVAGIYNTKDSMIIYIYNANNKYKNVYYSNVASEAYIPGDATYETARWKNASNSNFVRSSSSGIWFERSGYGVFNFNYSYYYGGNDVGFSNYSSRACVVCGVGL